MTPCADCGRRRGPHDTDARAAGARHRRDRPHRARRHRPPRRRGRAGPRPHASLRGGDVAASERRRRHRRPYRARIARRRTARCQCRLPRLDRPAADGSGRCRAPRNLRTACRLSLITAPDPPPVLPATESPGGAPRRDRAAHRNRRAGGDDHPAGDARVERVALVGDRDSRWWCRPVAYGAAETAPVDDRDVAAVAARTLYQDGHVGGDYVLTGPESLSQAEQVRIIGDVLGRRIPFAELSPDDFRRETEGRWPRPVVDMLLAAWGATMGRPAFITSTVSDILGSAPRSFRQWVADHAAAFREDPANDGP